ncbi:Zinc finger, RING/FYVE/PHD-type [Artemisia annua]|uniref:RING-type E3 ubiquitin transferase n=1 Tax=Artemisia annua TaxID=35608 RepID=A0A2U1MB88_ARTAN|nr:Zinc finger, RING/FYVE/PHD-type [Artemisia annua]
MGSNNFENSGVMDLTRNIMIMSIIGLFVVMIFAIVVHYFSKRRLQRMMEEYNNQMQSREQRGLDASFLKTIKVVEFDPKDFKEGLECAVCISDVEEGEKTRILPKCQHRFHVECIDMWFQSHSTCPICRNLINDQTEILVEQQESTSNVLLEGDENRERPDLVIDIPREEGNDEEDEKTPASCSRMKSLKRIMSGSSKFNPFSPVLLIGSWRSGVRGRLVPKRSILASSTSQTLKDLHAGTKEHFKKVKTSFRKIPPSRWNPIQNK